MAKYFSILGLFALFLFFMAGEIVLYYTYGRHHSAIPFILIGIPTIIVGVITGMALYQTYQHRNDEQPW